MSFNNDVDLVADSFSDCLESFVADQQIAAGKAAVQITLLGTAFKVNFVDVNFDGVIAVCQCLFSSFRILFGRRENFLFFRIAPAELQLARIRAEFVAAFPAEKLVAGNAEDLAFDVPKRNINGAHAGRNNRAAALTPEGLLLHLVPDVFAAHGIFTDQKTSQIFCHAEARRSPDTICHADFAKTGDTFIGVDADDNRAPFSYSRLKRILHINDVDADDLHFLLLD